MPPARVLWVGPPDRRPDGDGPFRLLAAGTRTEALETLAELDSSGVQLDAVVAAPELPDGDGGAVLRAVRDRWPDAACFLHGDLWAIPEGSSLPVCEFHPVSQTPTQVAEAVAAAIRGRYHRPYPISEAEERRLQVAESIDVDARRDELGGLAASVGSETGATSAFVSVVYDHTVDVVSADRTAGDRIIPRGDSACTYAIVDAGTTVIDDVAGDGRLSHVTESCGVDLRSYAARPLVVDAAAVGTLGLIDDEPGAFDSSRLDTLVGYAEEVQRVLATAR